MAREQNKKIAKSETAGERAAKAILGDAHTQKMKKLSDAVGNGEIQSRISQGNLTRDEMMLFLASRLKTIRQVQLEELKITHKHSPVVRNMWKEISDNQKPDVTNPDPSRWGAAAKFYEQASTALCRGDVARGSELIQRALHVEQQVFGKLTKLVDTKDIAVDPDPPSAFDAVVPHQTCGPCEEPAEVPKLAAEIINVTASLDPMPNKKRVADPWWTLEEEEEEEGGDDGG